MTKAECEYCCDEGDCVAVEHTIDCIFCECQSKYPTNDTCPRCLHDRASCTCSEEEQQKEIDELLQKLEAQTEEFKNLWMARLKSETE